MVGTVAGRLAEARRRRFVGRAAEIELLRAALAKPDPDFTVLYVYGPGGIGKTALLGALAQVASEHGLEPVRLDGRSVEPVPFTPEPRQGRLVLLIDTYEALAPLDGWVRETLVPSLPEDAVVVLAGRSPPDGGWYSDPAWRDLLRVVRLGELSAADVRDFARAAGLPEALHRRLAEVTHGHPLALVLLADVLATSPGADVGLTDAPDVVGRLVECFMADAPGDRHRQALQVCAHARFTTEQLLRAALGDDAGGLFAWLRGLPFVEHGPFGIFPHDLVRDVVRADLRWRDPAGFTEMHHRIRDHLLAHVRTTEGREQYRWVIDVCFLIQANPLAAEFWDWDRLGSAAYLDLAGPADRAAILELAARYEGPEAAALLDGWLDRPGAVAAVFRGPDSFGFSLVLRPREMSEEDLAFDPVVAAAWRYVRECGPLRANDEVVLARFFMDRDHYQGPSATRNTAMIRQIQRLIASPDLALDFVCAFTGDVDRSESLLSHLGYRRLPEVDVQVGAVRYSAFLRDWRGRTVRSWLDMVGEREVGLSAPVVPWTPPLSRREFAEAVRRALRHLHAPDRLATSPLLDCRLADDPAGLRDALRRAMEDLRGEQVFPVLDRTYLRAAQTQERAAEALSMSFSTYRRHLARGIARLVDVLWSRELNDQ
ncbi:AAA family ATPase [Thermomonospora umbrina]|uniref:AAA ATPase-like protein n=1 Tax=Thermomonospora umbrina TaxID=111806 RepID=A0A3D9SS59_9ACTN|nr:ATP-binding protein [Thermomonospora umbrina]REE96803.1 AAA ATPase-like protein [Thermomonospora umbrina]